VANDQLNTLIAFPDWIVAVTQQCSQEFFCWVITPDLAALTDGEIYTTSQAALAAGRSLVQCSTGPQVDFSHCRLYQD
jgi:deoxyribose-phosphate aldolase